MKKVLSLLAVIAIAATVICFAGCGEKVTAKVIDYQLTSEEYAFAVNPKDADLLAKVNAFLKEIQGNGKFDEVVGHYFGEGSPVEITSAKEDSTKDQLIVVTEPGFEPFEYTSGDKYVGIDKEGGTTAVWGPKKPNEQNPDSTSNITIWTTSWYGSYSNGALKPSTTINGNTGNTGTGNTGSTDNGGSTTTPTTGDSMPQIAFMVLALLSALGLTGAVIAKKKARA